MGDQDPITSSCDWCGNMRMDVSEDIFTEMKICYICKNRTTEQQRRERALLLPNERTF